jgi:phage shock protein A
LRQEIQDLRERVNLEGEIRSLEQKINALTQDVQYIKAKLNAMEKVNSFKQELNKLKDKKAIALN